MAPELAAIDVQGIDRHSFIVRGAVAAGAVYGLGAVGPFVHQAIAQEGGGDVDILNFALTLEYLEATFYNQALRRVRGLSGDVKSLAGEIRDNEVEHVAALSKTIKSLGGKPVKAPGVDFGNAFANEKSFLKLAQTFEDTGVSAYNGGLDKAGLSGDAKALATEIRDNEVEHVAALTKAITSLGGQPVKAPRVDFGSAFANQKSFLALAQTFEDTGVSAYNGAGPSIESKEVLAAAGSIVQIEARHAAAIRSLNGKPITDGGFDKSLDTKAVLKAVEPFVKS